MDIWPLGASPETSTTSATSGVLSSTSDYCEKTLLANIFDIGAPPPLVANWPSKGAFLQPGKRN
jgi:hypothetical protein